MHDAPLISPENKDSGAEIFAGLPKVSLHEYLPHDAATPGELTAATRAAVAALAADNVVYAELRLAAEAYPFAAAAAVDAALAGLDVPGIDARLVVLGLRHTGRLAEMAQLAQREGVVGFDIAGEPSALLPDLEGIAADLRAAFVPWELHATSFEDVAAAVRAGVTRLSHAVDLTDDFSADLDGVVPGRVSAWVRDRRIPVTFSPLLEQDQGLELADHPLPLLQQLGFTCTISAGQPAAGSLSEQFVALSETFGYGLEEFFDLTVKAVENSWSGEEDRQRLLEETILPAYEKLADPEFAEDAVDTDTDFDSDPEVDSVAGDC